MKTWDSVVIGGGLIGITLALALRRRGATVAIVESGQPGREASHAAAGMLAHCDPHTPPLLRALAASSASRYREFVHELQDESGERIDFREDGTIALLGDSAAPDCPEARPLSTAEVAQLEPGLRGDFSRVSFLPEASVDPRTLIAAALKAAIHREIHIASGAHALEVLMDKGRAAGVRTERTQFHAGTVVNCAGAWASKIAPIEIPTRPVKGQMLALAAPISYDQQGTPYASRPLRYVVRSERVYLVPRSDGRVVIGSTVEDAGFDKRVYPEVVQHLHQHALALLPSLAEARILESWAGLRPGTPDGLPIMGATRILGYFAATGHYRDGILLAPVTAHLMAQLISSEQPDLDLAVFSPQRFAP